MKLRSIETETHEGVATLWLNRPAVRNAMDEHLIEELTEVIRQASADRAVRVVVLAGRGPAFCAGADLDWMRRMAVAGQEENRASALQLAQLLDAIYTCPKPTIARVHGAAYAGGMGLVAACDLRVAEPGATFCLSEVRIGLVPATISPHVIRGMGHAAAQRYMLTAERLSAVEAARLGFIHVVSDPGAIDCQVSHLIRALKAGGPAALTSTKTLLRELAGEPSGGALLGMTANLIASVRASAEGRAGLKAFLEKRTPVWDAV